MRLEEYLAKYRTPIIQIAKAIGVSRPTINRILQGDFDMKLSTAWKLSQYTEGAVSLEELLPKNLGKKKKKS